MNPSQSPLVSIVIPAFNPAFFERALQDALAQSYANLEVIVCDDCPTDAIKAIVDALSATTRISLRYVRNPQRLGFVGNLQACLNEARGEFIKFLCDDDRLFPTCIAEQAQVLALHAEVSLVLAQRTLCDADDVQLPMRLENIPLASVSVLFNGADMLSLFETSPHNFVGGLTSALMRRADVQTLLPALTQPGQGFAALLDLVLYVCLLKRGNLAVLGDILSAERLHPGRLSRQHFMKDLLAVETRWLQAMLKGRDSEAAPAEGWVRCVAMQVSSVFPRVWEEVPLSRIMGDRQTTLPFLVGSTSESFSELYEQWLACRTLSRSDRVLLPGTMAGWPRQPKIVTVIVDDTGGNASLRVTLDTLAAQVYPPELTLVLSVSCDEAALEGRVFTLPLLGDGFDQLNQLLPQLDGADWIYLLRASDRLTDCALLMLAERIALSPRARCLYSDEGGVSAGESVDPVFKPDFNLDLLRSYPYVGRTLAFERDGLMRLGGFDCTYGALAPQDALWRLIEDEGDEAVEHISEILVESALTFAQWLSTPSVIAHSTQVLQAHLERTGVAHRLVHDDRTDLDHVDYLHADMPLVSIIINHKDQLHALQRCIQSLLETTAYSRYEVLIVDHGSVATDALDWLDAMAQMGSEKLRVLHCAGVQSAAAVRNVAAGHAQGEYLLMLSPFAVITQADWLDALLNHAQRPEVAVVGAKIVSPQGYVLHAGLVLGFQGPAGTAFYGESLRAEGYMRRLQVVQNLSAVGPDCLMVRRQLFDALGGLDEAIDIDHLSHADLCLKARQHGYLVVWTPRAVLALDDRGAPEHTLEVYRQLRDGHQLMYRRWLPILARDPAYNPNLRLSGVSHSLEPGMRKGWSPLTLRQLPRILAIPVNTTAVGHYRVSQPFLELEAAGAAVGSLVYSMPSIIELERQSPDVIVLQGRYVQGAVDQIVALQSYSKARRIYELDDYVISIPEKNGHTRNIPTDMERLVRLGTSMCDRIVVSTQPLADALSSMHHDIRVVPNMLASHLWGTLHSKRRTSSKPRVGWGGGTSHGGDLELIAEVIRTLADEVEWVFFGMCPKELRPYVKEFHPVVGLHAYPAKLASLNLDLALAPLEHHIFNDCKSNLRLLEYGACGYPVICSDTLAYRGYLPCTRVVTNSTQEWLDAIRMHLADPDASYRQGDELRQLVRRDYMLRADNLQHWVNGWLAD